jgi:LysR family glycine cleavage system transcriptional activator
MSRFGCIANARQLEPFTRNIGIDHMARYRLPPLNSIKAFESAARLKSFSQAADELSVTNGAISRHVQQLEDWLRIPLFVRLHRRVELTDEGAAYLIDAGAAFDRLALATARLMEERTHRVLRVKAMVSLTLRWLVPRLSGFQRAHPNIEVRLTTSDVPVPELTTGFDVIIRGGPDVAPGFNAFAFLSDSHLPVCSPKLLAQRPIHRIADLEQHTFIHAATMPAGWTEWLAAAGAEDLQPLHSLTFEHVYVALQAAIDGLGIAMGLTAFTDDDVADGRLVRPFSEPVIPSWRYHAYVPKDRSGDPAINQFLEWLQATGNS